MTCVADQTESNAAHKLDQTQLTRDCWEVGRENNVSGLYLGTNAGLNTACGLGRSDAGRILKRAKTPSNNGSSFAA